MTIYKIAIYAFGYHFGLTPVSISRVSLRLLAASSKCSLFFVLKRSVFL